MDSKSTPFLQRLKDLANQDTEVAVLWLYGSQAKGGASSHSDWDLAIAFAPIKLADPLDNRLRPELLAMDWQRSLGLAEGKLSIVDINQAAISLAFAAIDANCVLFYRDDGRLFAEEARVMSQMELNCGRKDITALLLSLERYQMELLEIKTLLAAILRIAQQSVRCRFLSKRASAWLNIGQKRWRVTLLKMLIKPLKF